MSFETKVAAAYKAQSYPAMPKSGLSDVDDADFVGSLVGPIGAPTAHLFVLFNSYMEEAALGNPPDKYEKEAIVALWHIHMRGLVALRFRLKEHEVTEQMIAQHRVCKDGDRWWLYYTKADDLL